MSLTAPVTAQNTAQSHRPIAGPVSGSVSGPRWPRFVSPVAGLWYAFGFSQAVIGWMADAASTPALIWVAYFLACGAGIAGSAALVFARPRAHLQFMVSLVSAALYFGWLFMFGAPAPEEYGIGGVVIGITALLAALTRRL